MTQPDDVASVLGLVEEERFDEALELALRVWQTTRSSTVAVVVEWLDDRCQERVTHPDCADDDAFDKAWVAIALGAPDPVTTGWLARTIGRHLSAMELARDRLHHRLDLLSRLGPDPRFGKHLIPILEAVDSSTPVVAVLDALTAAGDPRIVVSLAMYGRRPPGSERQIRARVLLEAPSVIAALDAVNVNEPSDRQAWYDVIPRTQVVDAETEELRRELLELVHAEPSDMDRRRVYGDFLLQHDDPHGEFIMLQLQAEALDAAGEPVPPTQQDRMDELEERFGHHWLGENLAMCLQQVVFQGGFAARAMLSWVLMVPAHRWTKAASDPGLRTLRALELGRGASNIYWHFVLSEAMPNLREVHIHRNDGLLSRLKRSNTPRRIEMLVFHERPPPDGLADLRGYPSLQKLKGLGFVTTERDAIRDRLLHDRAFLDGIEELRFVFAQGRLGELHTLSRLWAGLPDHVRTMSIYRGLRQPFLVFTRTPSGVHVDFDRTLDHFMISTPEVISVLPTDMISLRFRCKRAEDDLIEHLGRLHPGCQDLKVVTVRGPSRGDDK